MFFTNKKREISKEKLMFELDNVLFNDKLPSYLRNNLYIPIFRVILSQVLFSKANLTFSELIVEIKKLNFDCNLLISELEHVEQIQYNTKSFYSYDKNNLKSLLNNFINNLFETYNSEQMQNIYNLIKEDFFQKYIDEYSVLYLNEDSKNLENNLSFFYEIDVAQRIILSLKNQIQKYERYLLSQGLNEAQIKIFLKKLNIFSSSSVNDKDAGKDATSEKIYQKYKFIKEDYAKKIKVYIDSLVEHKFTIPQITDFLIQIGFSDEFINSFDDIQISSKYKEVNEKVQHYIPYIQKFHIEIEKLIISQKKAIDFFLLAIFANGHLLIEGAPGLAKTAIIKVISKTLDCKLNRIQFTADMLPSDIIGFNTYTEGVGFSIVKGPIFANIILADEINRTSPKVQSAMLEAMEEKQVTIRKGTFNLERPFLVFATQNPIDSVGTYTLPHAQLDRFLFKVNIDYLKPNEEYLIIDQNLATKKFSDYNIEKIFFVDDILTIQQLINNIYISSKLKKYVVELVNSTRSGDVVDTTKNKLAKYVEWGAGPRATIQIIISAKANAFYRGRSYVIDNDIKEVIFNVLKHRIIINYEGQAKNITSIHVIKEILNNVPIS